MFFFACNMYIVGLYKDYFEVKVNEKIIRKIMELPFSHEATWFFDGATKGEICLVDVVLRLNKDHFYTLKLNCGYGNNTKDEFISLWCFSKVASSFGSDFIKQIGDYKVIVNWAKCLYNMQVIDLQKWCWRK